MASNKVIGLKYIAWSLVRTWGDNALLVELIHTHTRPLNEISK